MSGESDLALAIRLARAAGLAIEQMRRAGYVTSDKLDRSPVTEADLLADRIITEGLEAARPGTPILSEESHWSGGLASNEVWCVDPIDGTEAFIDPRARGYAVQIAKLENQGGVWRPMLGVVFEPNHDELFAAVSGGGLTFERGGVPLALPPQGRATRRVVTSTRAPSRLRQALFERGYGDAGTLRSVGVKVAHLLKGGADIYPAAPALAYWDLAAPQVILEAGGGVVTDVDGEAPLYRIDQRETRVALPMVLTLGVDHGAVLKDVQAIAAALGYA